MVGHLHAAGFGRRRNQGHAKSVVFYPIQPFRRFTPSVSDRSKAKNEGSVLCYALWRVSGGMWLVELMWSLQPVGGGKGADSKARSVQTFTFLNKKR